LFPGFRRCASIASPYLPSSLAGEALPPPSDIGPGPRAEWDFNPPDASTVRHTLCRFRKQPEPVVVLQRGAMALDQVAQATQPACIHELGKVHQLNRPLLPVDQDTTPTAMSPLRRQNPREEPRDPRPPTRAGPADRSNGQGRPRAARAVPGTPRRQWWCATSATPSPGR